MGGVRSDRYCVPCLVHVLSLTGHVSLDDPPPAHICESMMPRFSLRSMEEFMARLHRSMEMTGRFTLSRRSLWSSAAGPRETSRTRINKLVPQYTAVGRVAYPQLRRRSEELVAIICEPLIRVNRDLQPAFTLLGIRFHQPIMYDLLWVGRWQLSPP